LRRVTAIDLVGDARYACWPVEDQRPRQTCVAFAVTACLELLRAKHEANLTPLSPQYLYWHMRQHPWPGPPPPGWDEGATKLGYANDVLSTYGICRAESCPYVAYLPVDAPLEGPEPSDVATTEALADRISDSYYVDYPDPATRPSGIAQQVYDLLAEQRPVAISLPLFYLNPENLLTTLDNPQTLASGQVCDPPPGAAVPTNPSHPSTPGHAVCVVGFQPDRDEAIGGWFIFRNSLGLDWADALDPENAHAPLVPVRGYGAISASYVEHCTWEIFSPRLP